MDVQPLLVLGTHDFAPEVLDLVSDIPGYRVDGSELGEGTIVSAGLVIATRTKIGRHVIVNRGALIGHDVEIGDFVTMSPVQTSAASAGSGTDPTSHSALWWWIARRSAPKRLRERVP